MACAGKRRGVKVARKKIQKVSPEEKSRGAKLCARCKLHGKKVEQSREHSAICPFMDCPNFLCNGVTTLKRLIMKIQLDVWRKRNPYISQNKRNEKTLCDTCRNHLIRTNKKGHHKHCKFNTCQGILCRMTVARRKVVSFFLKIIRSQIRCEVFEVNYQKAISEYKKTANQQPNNKCADAPKRTSSLPLLQMPSMEYYPPVPQKRLDNPQRVLYDPDIGAYGAYPRDTRYYSIPAYHAKSAPYHTHNSYFQPHQPPLVTFHGHYDRPNIFLNYVNYNIPVASRNQKVVPNGVKRTFIKHRNPHCYNPGIHRPWE